MEHKDFLTKLDEGKLDEAGPSSPYSKNVLEAVRKELLTNINDMIEDDPEEDYKKELAATKAAKNIGQLADVARDMAWDYESFINVLLDALGAEGDEGSALFNPRSWDT